MDFAIANGSDRCSRQIFIALYNPVMSNFDMAL
jgi:hypothetical protein